MAKYLRIQIHAFKKGTSVHKFLYATLLELAKFVSILLLFVIFLFAMANIFNAVVPLLTSLSQAAGASLSINEELIEQTLQQKYLLDIFIVRILALILIFIIAVSAVIALFNTMIMERLRNKKWNLKRFMKLFYIYSALSLLYFSATFLFMHNLAEFTAMAITTAILTMIYLYLLPIFAMSIDDRKIWKDIKHGILSAIRVHRTIPTLIIGFLVFLGILAISELMLLLINTYAVILFMILLAMWSVWMKNYQDHVLMEYDDL
ncbi:MAG: hypothetical protein ACP5OA_01885 [Candidatus Woesearchaeota archaeon]